jgi:hypothetical protein
MPHASVLLAPSGDEMVQNQQLRNRASTFTSQE